ncbi:metallophosphoesterase family protein [Nonlabens xiamenensis]|uniref:hypothetical protein n=1 Tax=Nonlabens xiamenensis TaxID=2341043 RepID=UPI001F0BD45C|nr:hypothetical protein [Nonlabens xiamenensis]
MSENPSGFSPQRNQKLDRCATYENKSKMKQFILLFQPFSKGGVVQIDFKSEKPASDFIEFTKLDGYNVYQYIQSDFTYNMSIAELESENIGFKKLYREKKTWFGLSKKTVIDLLIEQQNGFYYPYGFGNYLYLFSKQKINQSEFEKWLNKEFPSRFGDIDGTFAGFNSELSNLMNEDDYLIATNHDYQEHFGLTGKAEIIEQIILKFNDLNLAEYETEK